MQKAIILLGILAMLCSSAALAELKIIDSTSEFNQVIAEANVPVLVQFSAYWCGPCQRLKETLTRVAPSYNEDQIILAYVDAYVNTELKKYLDGGYPTVRVFKQGKEEGEHFVGSKSESFVRQFIDDAISGQPATENRGEFKIIETTEEFNNLIATARVPVFVQFSAYWCGPCKRLKETITRIAPDYSEDQIIIAYVDAYVNSELRRYLDGGYPTVRVFKQGKQEGEHFVGSQSESFVRRFINNAINDEKIEGIRGELKIIGTTQEFNDFIATSPVPVMVQFSAAWCSPCQRLKQTLIRIAPSYSQDQVVLAYVDADINSELRRYLDGGYPTVRVFKQGKTAGAHFVGSQSESFVRRFIDNAIGSVATSPRGELKIIDTTEEFNNLVANSSKPVMVQFSAYWCGPCQRLKKTLTLVAPDYSEEQIVIAYVDAYVNTELKKYLDGGYPTVRVFKQGKVEGEHFVGSKSETFVREFIDKAISK